MNRRKFIAGAAAGLGAAYLGPRGMAAVLDAPALAGKGQTRLRRLGGAVFPAP